MIVIEGLVWSNSSLPGQNGCHLAEDVFRCIFVNEKFCISIKISLKFLPKGPIDNNWALVYKMARHWIGDKPLSEPMLTWFTDAYMRLQGEMSYIGSCYPHVAIFSRLTNVKYPMHFYIKLNGICLTFCKICLTCGQVGWNILAHTAVGRWILGHILYFAGQSAPDH